MGHEGGQLMGESGLVGEGELLGVVFEEEVEGIDDGHVGDQVDFHFEMLGDFGVNETREVVALRVLLPVEEMVSGLNAKRVTEDGRAAMGSGAEANHLGSEGHQTIVGVGGFMVKGYADAHDGDDSTGGGEG